MSSIQLRGIRVEHDDEVVLDDVDLVVDDGTSVVVLGRSGSGKTSLLRTIAGLLRPTRGRVLVGGVDVTRNGPGDRGLGMVAQGAPLQPTMTVEGNVHFPLEVRRVAPEERRRRADAEMRAFRVSWLRNRRPNTLSAGQRQAAATARSLVSLPRAMLLDEPVSHLDAHTRAGVLQQVRTIQQGAGTTMLVTTNDVETARRVGDAVAVIAHGGIAQTGTLEAVAAAPVSVDVADLVWIAPAPRLAARPVVRAGLPTLLRTAAGDLRTWSPAAAGHEDLVVAPDPAHLSVTPDGRDETGTDEGAGLLGVVRRVVPLGGSRSVVVATEAGRLDVPTREDSWAVGDPVRVHVGRAVLAGPDGRTLAVL